MRELEKNKEQDVIEWDENFILEEPRESIEDELDRYMKEAQKNDIGYLNGDGPKEKQTQKKEKEEKIQ